MSNSKAWGIASVSPAVRRNAEQAAGSAGVTVEQRLDQAIAEHVSSTSGAKPDRESGDENAPGGSRARGPAEWTSAPRKERPPFPSADASAPDLKDPPIATVGPAPRHIARNEDVVANVLQSIDSLLGRVRAIQAGREPDDPEERSSRAVSARPSKSPPPLSAEASSLRSVGGPDAEGKATDQRIDAFSAPSREPSPAGARAAAPRSFDLQSAVSQIASRRRALDAHQAHDGLEPPRRDLRGSLDSTTQPSSSDSRPGLAHEAARAPPGGACAAAQFAAAGGDAAIHASTAPPEDLRLSFQTVCEKLDALRREWSETRSGPNNVASLQDQVAAMRSGLAGLASREGVAALERSMRDLAQQFAAQGREGRGEPGQPAMDRIANEMREALRAYDPKIAAADLERRIESLGARIDALSAAMIGPETIEPIRRQVEEVHDLLITAAERSVPFDRLEGQLADLADRVERLAANVAQSASSVQAELLETLRRQTESATGSSAPSSSQDVSGRLNREVASPSPAAPDFGQVNEAARRIDAALTQSQFAANRVEEQLNALNAKIDAAGAESFATLIRDLSAKLDAVETKDRESRPIEPILSEIVEKLDRLPMSEPWLRSRVAAGAAPLLDEKAVNSLAEEVARRLEGRLAEQALIAAVPDAIAQLNGRLDAITGRLSKAGALERAAGNRLERLEGKVRAVEPADTGLDLDRLVDRLSGDESDRGPPTRQRDSESRPGSGARGVHSAALAALDDVAPRPHAVRPELASRHGRTGAPRDPDEEFLLEPGSGAPQRFQPADDPAQSIGSRTNPAISAHIAAARRAAQSAVAESTDAESSTGWPYVERNLQEARRIYVRHRRSVLVAAAVVLAITAAARLMSAHIPLMQKSELEAPTVRESTQGLPRSSPGAAGPIGAASSSADLAPTGSIGRNRGVAESRSGGAPTPPDLSAAIPSGLAQSLREAVLSGVPAAQYELAQRLLEGRALSQDQKAAAFWFERAASAGFAPAEFRLGALYQKGVGVERDPTVAKRWYTAAALSGNARAAHNLAVMNAEQAGEKADYVEAAKWFRRAAEMGVRDSQFNLAVLYARGLGVDRDLRQSWIWFSLAAAQGDAEAGKKRDEVAAKMDPTALAAAADELSRVKIREPDPAANDVGATSGSFGDTAPAGPASPTPPKERDEGSRSGA